MYDYIKRRDGGERSRQLSNTTTSRVVRRVGSNRIVGWLSRGASDIVACRGRSLVYGFCYVAMGHAIVWAHKRDGLQLEGLMSGFLILGPLLAVGTYELSRQRERGERADLVVSLFAWCRNPRGLCLHATLLCVVLTLWLQLSWVLFGRTDALSTVNDAGLVLPILSWAAWIALAVIAFASSVVAVPMLLDRSEGILSAIRTSFACCLSNPVTMGIWAATTVLLIGISVWLSFWPLLLSGPWIGHATWHVYQDCVGEHPHQCDDTPTQ